jgi:hypothetical protein
MEITYQQVLDGLNALAQLEPPGKVLKLKAITRLTLARNQRRLKNAGADFEAAVAPLRAMVKPGDKGSPKLEKEFQEALKQKVEVLIGTIKESELNLDENAIPCAILGDILDWMIVADGK